MQTSGPAASSFVILNKITCPVCGTHFDPHQSSGQCPVCGEQVVPESAVMRFIPMLTPAWLWLKGGGWRLALLVVFVLYQIGLFIFIWHSLADAHVL
ncbi:MAG TPA: hypothetical protein VF040_01855 [Ktedonobacterales bacterium]